MTTATTLDVFTFLDKTHQDVQVFIKDLENLINECKNDPTSSFSKDRAQKILTFFNEEARQHHLDEELHIFPSLLEKNDEQLSSIVQKLKLDHNWIEQTWSDLSPHLEAMVEGFSWFDPDLVLHGLEIMQSQYADHMALEELTAYPEARKAIGEKEAEEMIKEILERRH